MAGGKDDPCRFGGARLKTRIRAFASEIDGVREGRDPESVHRMRVASRRLRSALPLFEGCFDPVQYRRYLKTLKAVTRALGAARDTDVQLQFLDRYERGRPGEPGSGGIRKIRKCLEKDRRDEQATILSALSRIEEEEVLTDLAAAAKAAAAGKLRGIPERGQKNAVVAMAASRIHDALCDLLSYGPAVRDPADTAGHHALRISAKKLRYILEVFRPLCKNRLRPALDGIRHLQELLGQIHDCDVWLLRLSSATDAAGAEPAPGNILQAVSPLLPGEREDVAALLADRQAARNDLYRQLLAEWETAVEGRLTGQLSAVTGRKGGRPEGKGKGKGKAARPAAPSPADAARTLAGTSPETEGHARQVTLLALMLFDDLLPLHRQGKRDRRLLEYAGLLHDIGWAGGQEGHQERSGRMILADRTLPVTPRERRIIALAARCHGKALPRKRDRGLALLKKKDRRCALALASLLRIADGLDYTHGNRVASVSCAIGSGAVTCTPACNGDCSAERARALAKADLFEQVFRKRFVIP